MIRFRFTVSLLLLAFTMWSVTVSTSRTSNVTTLHFMFLTAQSGGFFSGGSVPAMEIALERINTEQRILPGYQLENVPVVDSQVRKLYVLFIK